VNASVARAAVQYKAVGHTVEPLSAKQKGAPITRHALQSVHEQIIGAAVGS
jgi:hypothetical protein